MIFLVNYPVAEELFALIPPRLSRPIGVYIERRGNFVSRATLWWTNGRIHRAIDRNTIDIRVTFGH